MNLAPPIPRFGLPGRQRELTPEEQRKTANRQPARTRTGSVVQRERHQAGLRDPGRGRRAGRARHPDGLFVVGDPRLPAERGHLRDRRPQVLWAVLGVVVMVVIMRVDYRYLRLVSVPFYIVAVGLLVIVFAAASAFSRSSSVVRRAG